MLLVKCPWNIPGKSKSWDLKKLNKSNVKELKYKEYVLQPQ